MHFKICICLLTIVWSYSEQCSLVHDHYKCQYNLFCSDKESYYGRWQDLLHSNMRQEPYDEIIECPRQIEYNGYSLDPVYFVYKTIEIDPTEPVPLPDPNRFNSDWFGPGIYSLDLSENEYEITPVIDSLDNLATLNISRNHLTIAGLSNLNELNKLTEIDFSYNTINNISVKSYEHPYSNLEKINISHNYLVNIPDAVFDKFGELNTLDLSYNFIEGLSPFTFEGVKNLLHLNLSNNRLTELNSSLFRFWKLKILSLSNNKIKDLQLTDFDKLDKLEFLDLSSNSIKTLDTDIFQNNFILNSLDLSNNLLETMSNQIFANLRSLNNVDLSRNKLKSLAKGLFKNNNILSFSIDDNLLEGSLAKGMLEGVNVDKLIFNHQLLTAIEDYAFYGLTRLQTLSLNNNEIQTLSNLCFKTLTNLHWLDLSNNHISSIDFNKEDLVNLQSLLLNNNQLNHISQEHFRSLNSLEFLDLSENAISRLEPSSFHALRNLINLQISSNPLSGTLETDTFEGLVLLPSLDISRNLLTTIQNASFNDMHELKELNISGSKIKKLEYNAFVNTGYIETLDLSFNKLENLFVNMTELVGLNTLLLNNNLLKTISPTLLHGLSSLNKISLAHNAIENIYNESFSKLNDLRFLDLSYNEKLNFAAGILSKTKNLNILNLSGIKPNINFAGMEDPGISEVVISNVGLHNISVMKLRLLTHLSTIVLSNNNVSMLEKGAFSGIGKLTRLDLSFNKISFIQPGAFKDNTLLVSLNISHNYLSIIGYGIFRGLYYLNSLDISYNSITDLETERFYEVKSLSELIVDHNIIKSVNAEEFVGTSLSKLSIGDNPLPCRILVKLKNAVPFEITAINLDEHNAENIDGVTCNKEPVSGPTSRTYPYNNKNAILVDIRDILFNLSTKNTLNTGSNGSESLPDLTNFMEKSNTLNSEKVSQVIKLNNGTNILLKGILQILEQISVNTIHSVPVTIANSSAPVMKDTAQNSDKLVYSLQNMTNMGVKYNSLTNEKLSEVIDLNNNTNVLLNRILKSLDQNPAVITTSAPLSDVNDTIDIIAYINAMKKELAISIEEEKKNFINELKAKYSLVSSYQTESLPTSPSNEKFVSNNEAPKSLFTETCVAIILVILVGFVLYKFYKYRMFIRSRLSFSTRELSGAMDNSTL